MYESFGLIGIQLPEKYKENFDISSALLSEFMVYVVLGTTVRQYKRSNTSIVYKLLQYSKSRQSLRLRSKRRSSLCIFRYLFPYQSEAFVHISPRISICFQFDFSVKSSKFSTRNSKYFVYILQQLLSMRRAISKTRNTGTTEHRNTEHRNSIIPEHGTPEH